MDIDISHLTFRFAQDEKAILDDIDLHISSGEWLLISGKSGSGKTTLAYAISGILYQRENACFDGHVRVGDLNVGESPLYQIADAVGLVQQNADDQFCALNVADEMAFGLENRCIPSDEMEERIHSALRLSGAEALYSRQLFELSGGEKQKIAIASILALEPSILILDEPTSNLDLASTQHIFHVLRDLHEKTHLTVIIIEHKVRLFADLFERCIYLEDGKIKSHSAGHISSKEAEELIYFLQCELGNSKYHFHPGVSYRHLFVGEGLDPRLACFPPHDHPGEDAESLMIQAKTLRQSPRRNCLMISPGARGTF